MQEGEKREAGLYGWRIGVWERGVGRVGWMGEWGEGERRGKGWIDG